MGQAEHGSEWECTRAAGKRSLRKEIMFDWKIFYTGDAEMLRLFKDTPIVGKGGMRDAEAKQIFRLTRFQIHDNERESHEIELILSSTDGYKAASKVLEKRDIPFGLFPRQGCKGNNLCHHTEIPFIPQNHMTMCIHKGMRSAFERLQLFPRLVVWQAKQKTGSFLQWRETKCSVCASLSVSLVVDDHLRATSFNADIVICRVTPFNETNFDDDQWICNSIDFGRCHCQ